MHFRPNAGSSCHHKNLLGCTRETRRRGNPENPLTNLALRTNRALLKSRALMTGYLGPQQVTSAGVEICCSDKEIYCGLSIIPSDRAPETIAATDDVPVRVDWLQHELQQGPCIGDDLGELLVSKDLAADLRWPDFGRMCVAVMNVRAMVSVQVPVALPDRARLNFYSSEPCAFDHLDVDAALRLARIASPMVRVVISEFREALLGASPADCSRVAIAVGTVIDRYKVNSAEAFRLLRDASHDLHRALLSVAIDVVTDGHLPVVAVRRSHLTSLSQRSLECLSGNGEARRRDAQALPSIGGPELWHDPSATEIWHSPGPVIPSPG